MAVDVFGDDRQCADWFYRFAPITWVFLAAFLVLAPIYIWRLNTRPNTKRIVPWWCYGLALGLAIISLIIQIANDALLECVHFRRDDILDWEKTTYQPLRILTQVLFYSPDYGSYTGLAWLLWLAIYMIALPRAMLQQANKSTKVAVIALSTAFGGISVFWITMTAYADWYATSKWDELWSGDIEDAFALPPKSLNALWATYTTLAFVGTLASSGLLVFARISMKRASRAIKGFEVSLLITMVSSVGATLLSMVVSMISVSQPEHIYTESEGIAIHVLELVFIYGVALGLLCCASSNRLSFFEASKDETKFGDTDSADLS